MAALFLAYKAGRLLTADQVGQAMANARDVWAFERALRLPSEVAVQRALLPAARVANLSLSLADDRVRFDRFDLCW